MKKTALIITLSLLGLTACSVSIQPAELIKIAALKQNGESAVNLRTDALRDTAIAIGAQGGLAWRAERIDCVLKCQTKMLDRIYNFRALLLRDNILPPVLGEGRDALNIANCETIRAADIMYRIITPPCFVSNPPNWRDYLWMMYEKPENPHASLLPKNRCEASIWNCYVRQGWQKGIGQADLIFDANLERLNRDYHGMLLYRKLLAQHMITAPFVAKADLGITGDEHEMRVNDRVLRITSTSRLNTNSTEWRAALQKQRPRTTKTLELEDLEVHTMSPPKRFKSEQYDQKPDCKNGK